MYLDVIFKFEAGQVVIGPPQARVVGRHVDVEASVPRHPQPEESGAAEARKATSHPPSLKQQRICCRERIPTLANADDHAVVDQVAERIPGPSAGKQFVGAG
jgi:hypothetical protein